MTATVAGATLTAALQLHAGRRAAASSAASVDRLGHAGGQVQQHPGARTRCRRRRARWPARSGRWRCRRRRRRPRPRSRSQSASGTPSRGALEAGVGRGVLALVEDRLQRLAVQGRVQLDAVGADDAVRRARCRRSPGARRSDAPGSTWWSRVATTCVVPPAGRDVRGDRRGDGGAPGDGQAAALAEVVLHVDDDQCAGHVGLRSGSAQRSGRTQCLQRRLAAGQRPRLRRQGLRAPRSWCARARSSASRGSRSAHGRPARTSGTTRSRSPSRGATGARADHLAHRRPVGVVPADRVLAAADRVLALGRLRHRHAVALDQLVDHADAVGAPGAGDQPTCRRRSRRPARPSARRSRTRRGRW